MECFKINLKNCMLKLIIKIMEKYRKRHICDNENIIVKIPQEDIITNFAISPTQNYTVSKSGTYGGVGIPFTNWIIQGDLFETTATTGEIKCKRHALVKVRYSFGASLSQGYILHYAGAGYMSSLLGGGVNTSIDTGKYYYEGSFVIDIPADTNIRLALGHANAFSSLVLGHTNISIECLKELN